MCEHTNTGFRKTRWYAKGVPPSEWRIESCKYCKDCGADIYEPDGLRIVREQTSEGEGRHGT